jgi:hypothetical protein
MSTSHCFRMSKSDSPRDPDCVSARTLIQGPPTVNDFRPALCASTTESCSLRTERLVIGHVSICSGCCCGNTAKGKPEVPVEWLKKEWRARGLLRQVHLSISGCLGPCDVANVVTIANERGTLWLGKITEHGLYQSILDWALASRHANAMLALPRELEPYVLQQQPFR